MKELAKAVWGLVVFLALAAPAFARLEKGLIFEQSAQIPSSHASTIVQLPDGDMLCAWYSGTAEGRKDVAIWASRFEQKSGKWSAPYVLADTANKSDGNPVLFVAPDGKVYLYFVTIEGTNWAMASIKSIVSEDGAKTFGPVQPFRKKWGWMPRNHLVTLASGHVLFPLYDEVYWKSVFMLSKDNCKTWQKAGKIPTRPGNIQPAVVQFDDGSLMSLSRTRGKRIWRSYSQDQGMTWSKAEEIDLPNPNAGIDLIRLESKELVLAFNNTDSKRTPLSIALSKDNGKTWPVIKNIETENFEFSYPSLAQAADGKIWLTYTWKRKAIGYAVFDLEWLQSN